MSTSLTWSRREASDTDDAPFRVIAADWGYEPSRDETYGHWHTLDGVAGDGFVYNMAWYSTDVPDEAFFFCVNGSGDSDVEFGLRGQQMDSANGFTTIGTDFGPFERIFAPSVEDPYTDVTGTSDHVIGDYVATEAMFGYGDLCTEEITSPFPTR